MKSRLVAMATAYEEPQPNLLSQDLGKTLGAGSLGSTCAHRPVRPSASTADLGAWAAGLYRGIGMTLLRDVPSHGVYFGVYDWTRDALEPGCRAAGHQSHTTALIAGESATQAALPGHALTV